MKKLIVAANFALLIPVLFFTACKEDESIQLPEPPSELTITAVSDTQIELAWSDNSVSEDGFKIERKSGLEAFILLTTVAKDVSIFTDTALMENTSYTYRVYAFNSAYELGAYSNEASSSTQGRPVISSSAITGITPFSAVGGGTITNIGGSTIIASGVVWGTSPGQTTATDTKTEDGSGESFVSAIAGLNWETLYYVRAYATNALGTGYGEEFTFTTEPLEITTLEATDITYNSGITGGSIEGEGGTSLTERGLVWGNSPNPTIESAVKIENGSGTGSFTGSLTRLVPNTKYYARAYASNSATTTYGAQISFITLLLNDPDGNIYRTVQIGTQVWMAENLRTTKYSDGSDIPLVVDINEWAALNTPAYTYVINDQGYHEDIYGPSYNWYAVDTDKLCPAGWHVPSMNEWRVLVNNLGGENVAGNKLRETGTAHWQAPNSNATDEAGFTALPGGFRSVDPISDYDVGFTGFWWSSDQDNSNSSMARDVDINSNQNNLRESTYFKENGMSVRCLSDY